MAHHIGKPDLMITATCGLNWPEITSQLLQGQTATTAPFVTAHVFKVCQSFPLSLLLVFMCILGSITSINEED